MYVFSSCRTAASEPQGKPGGGSLNVRIYNLNVYYSYICGFILHILCDCEALKRGSKNVFIKGVTCLDVDHFKLRAQPLQSGYLCNIHREYVGEDAHDAVE